MRMRPAIAALLDAASGLVVEHGKGLPTARQFQHQRPGGKLTTLDVNDLLAAAARLGLGPSPTATRSLARSQPRPIPGCCDLRVQSRTLGQLPPIPTLAFYNSVTPQPPLIQ